jgi:hypothetical protein
MEVSSFLKVEAIYSSELSVDSQRTTWHYTPEDRALQTVNSFIHCRIGIPHRRWYSTSREGPRNVENALSLHWLTGGNLSERRALNGKLFLWIS